MSEKSQNELKRGIETLAFGSVLILINTDNPWLRTITRRVIDELYAYTENVEPPLIESEFCAISDDDLLALYPDEPEPERPSQPQEITPPVLRCIDCGGLRSIGSAKRCRKCYGKKADTNLSTRGEVQCPECGSPASRKGFGPTGEQRYICRKKDCQKLFSAKTITGDFCACGRKANHPGVCAERYEAKRLNEPAKKQKDIPPVLVESDPPVDNLKTKADKRVEQNILRAKNLRAFQKQVREKALANARSESPAPTSNPMLAACGICRWVDTSRKRVWSQPHCPTHGARSEESEHTNGLGQSIKNYTT